MTMNKRMKASEVRCESFLDRIYRIKKNWRMREDSEALLELQGKTKAGEVAPLVDVAIKHFWLWPGKAYRAYQRKGEIAIEQLELRRRVGFPKDERVANVVTLFSQLYDEASWM